MKFAVFDIDGTLIRWQLYHAIADTLAKVGHINEATYAQIREARRSWKRRADDDSFKDYERQLVHAYDKALIKLTIQQFEEAAEAVFSEYKDQTYTYTRDLIKTLKKDGYLIWAISGSQSEIVAKIADYYGFDDFVGSTYGKRGDFFSGTKNLAARDKAAVLKSLIAKHGATLKGSVAVGDSESDIPMLKMVERPIAFNPTKLLFDEAKSQGWTIVLERKNVIYELKRDDGKYILA